LIDWSLGGFSARARWLPTSCRPVDCAHGQRKPQPLADTRTRHWHQPKRVPGHSALRLLAANPAIHRVRETRGGRLRRCLKAMQVGMAGGCSGSCPGAIQTLVGNSAQAQTFTTAGRLSGAVNPSWCRRSRRGSGCRLAKSRRRSKIAASIKIDVFEVVTAWSGRPLPCESTVRGVCHLGGEWPAHRSGLGQPLSPRLVPAQRRLPPPPEATTRGMPGAC